MIVTKDVEPQGDSIYGEKIETFIECSCGCCLFDEFFHEGFSKYPERTVEVSATKAWNTRRNEARPQKKP